MSRRDQIRLSEAEALELLEAERTVICATNGHDGWPHLMPLWYVVREGTVWAWTYAKSQKVRNLERDRRATLQVETGTEYHELRGVMLRTEATIHRDEEVVVRFGAELTARYAGTGVDPEEFTDVVRKQAAKRVALEFVERDRATWDHRKLAGVY
jgi:nitroimidazol reductase NimA-like FMN-containing flavoprotein (pyridoxamine 5'-phosphate oxidase superfamily)